MAKSYVNRKKGSKRRGLRYTIEKGTGAHLYKKKGGGVTRVGGKKKAVDPYKAEVDSAVNLEFGEADQQLDKERRISGQMMRNVDDWYRVGYQGDLERARQRTAQGYGQAFQQVAGQANTARTQDAAQASQMDAEAQKAAALRGTTAGPNVAAQAQASRNAQANAAAGLIASQGATQNAYMADQGRIGGGIRALELGKEQGRGRLIEEEARKVASKKGAYRVAKRAELSDAAYKRRLEAAAFGLKTEDTFADNARQEAQQRQAAKDRAAGRKVQKRGQNLTHQRTIRGQNLTDQRARENAAKQKAGGVKGGKGKGQARKEDRQKRSRFNSLIRHARKGQKPAGAVDPLMKSAVEEWVKNERKGTRGVSHKTRVKLWREFGILVPTAKKKKSKVKRPPNTPARGGYRPT